MIIRRRHTANFTTIGNALFEDKRLEADELGILAYLLSMPHDWEVRRPQLMKRFRVGRETMRRIMMNATRYGWVVPQRARQANGTFSVIYEVRDEPGPELSMEEVKATLAVASTASTGEPNGANGAEHDPDTGDPPETGEPDTASQGVASQGRQTGRGSKEEESQRTDSPNTDLTKIERDGPLGHDRKARFIAAFEMRWPTAATDDRSRTAAAARLVPEDEEDAALNGIGPFLEQLKKLGRKHPPAGWKYLEEKRWALLEKPKANGPTAGGPYDPTSEAGKALITLAIIAKASLPRMSDGRIIYTKPITPQLLALATAPHERLRYEIGSNSFGAWRELIRSHLSNPPNLTEIEAPWPYPPSRDGKTYIATGPPTIPGTLMTQEDEKELAKL